MLTLRRKSSENPRIHTELGTFEFDGQWWFTEVDTPNGSITVGLTAERFDERLICRAKAIMDDFDSWHLRALSFIEHTKPESLTQFGEISPSVLDITDLGRGAFHIEYLLANWPDASLAVVFERGKPVAIWEDD
jgi:hypothetical protein